MHYKWDFDHSCMYIVYYVSVCCVFGISFLTDALIFLTICSLYRYVTIVFHFSNFCLRGCELVTLLHFIHPS